MDSVSNILCFSSFPEIVLFESLPLLNTFGSNSTFLSLTSVSVDWFIVLQLKHTDQIVFQMVMSIPPEERFHDIVSQFADVLLPITRRGCYCSWPRLMDYDFFIITQMSTDLYFALPFQRNECVFEVDTTR